MKACSPHWEERKSFTGFMEDGFPFDEGFPTSNFNPMYKYTLIIRNGRQIEDAIVDPSTQYRAEGLAWRSANNEHIPGHIVIAWCEQ